jgi:hypothetical protein
MGYSATNTGESETMIGDATFTRTGPNTYTITVTKSGGTSLTGLFAPLTNPVGGQNNYAPLASPTFTGTVTSPNLTLTNGASSAIMFPNTSILGYSGAGVLNMTGGGHYNGTNWVADASYANMVAAGNSQIILYSNITTPGSTYTPVPMATFQTGSNILLGRTYTCSNSFSLAPNATHNLLSVGSYGATIDGLLTVFTAAPNAQTNTLFGLSTQGSGSSPSWGQISSSTYNGAPAPFTLGETPGASNTIYMTNTYSVAETVNWWWLATGGNAIATCY